ncbi:MAG: amidohydrolase family protein [Myxococcales bacterium]|nr:amidohydrolase family protein [Myxococcales bacterium]
MASRPPFVRSDIPRIDMHTHVLLGAASRAARLFDRNGIVHAVNLSGPPASVGLDDFIADSEIAYSRSTMFTNLDWSLCEQSGYAERMVEDLVRAKALGARGLKIPKILGLGARGPSGKLLAIDDSSLDLVFEKAGELGMPVAIHSGDPQAFWQEPSARNERYEELQAHPSWSFYAPHQRGEVPSWQALFEAFVRRVARHPKTIFIGVHFGNAPEDPELVARALDTYPNLLIDTAARLPAIGRRDANHSPERMRAFFLKYQDRILFGSDTAVGRAPDALMFGSTGKEPPSEADGDRFFEATWRYFETMDSDIPSPTPIQGRWNIAGIGLPRAVLEKIYYRNAARLLSLTISPTPLPKPEPKIVPGSLQDL